MAAVISPPISQHRLHALLPSVHKRGARRAQELQGPGSGTKFWGGSAPLLGWLRARSPRPSTQGPGPGAHLRPAPPGPAPAAAPAGALGRHLLGARGAAAGAPPGPFPAPAGASPQRLGAGGAEARRGPGVQPRPDPGDLPQGAAFRCCRGSWSGNRSGVLSPVGSRLFLKGVRKGGVTLLSASPWYCPTILGKPGMGF